MKRLALLVVFISCFTFGQSASYMEQITRAPSRYASNPVINYGGGGWEDSQIDDPVVMVDPSDSTQLIMFMDAMGAPISTGTIAIGRYTASVSSPYTWTAYGSNPIFTKSASGFDSYTPGVRLGSVVYDSGTFYMYYTGCNDTWTDCRIGLATSADGVTFTRYGATGQIVAPSGDETTVENADVIKVGSTWYMYYSYRTASSTLPGIRYATSSDGITWSKVAGDIIHIGNYYDRQFIEWHHTTVLDTGSLAMVFEAYDTFQWTLNLATAPSPTGPWTLSIYNPILTPSGTVGAFDRYHVATGAVYEIGGAWYLFYQGAGDTLSPYGSNHWALGMALYSSPEPVIRNVRDSSGAIVTVRDSSGNAVQVKSF